MVTGAASGIGRALADAFAAREMKLVLADVDTDGLERAAAELRAGGASVSSHELDVADRAAFARFADEAFDAFGAVHVLCNNAGIGRGGPIAEAGLGDWDWTLEVNLGGVIHGVHFFLPRMIAQDAPCHIVNTGSIAGLVATPGLGAYTASKYAVVGLSETLAAEMEQAGTQVGVSVLCPAWVRTQVHDSDRLAAGREGLADLSPASEEMRDQIRELIHTGLDPAFVAARTIEAIERGRLYILTHADYMPRIEQRFRAILDAWTD